MAPLDHPGSSLSPLTQIRRDYVPLPSIEHAQGAANVGVFVQMYPVEINSSVLSEATLMVW